ncbi:MAG: hypothetical protein M5U19_23535 [Microthrixaceae bacterium]|nr:hypothetical protein [Microthrixaceae bacterium]
MGDPASTEEDPVTFVRDVYDNEGIEALRDKLSSALGFAIGSVREVPYDALGGARRRGARDRREPRQPHHARGRRRSRRGEVSRRHAHLAAGGHRGVPGLRRR